MVTGCFNFTKRTSYFFPDGETSTRRKTWCINLTKEHNSKSTLTEEHSVGSQSVVGACISLTEEGRNIVAGASEAWWWWWW